MELRDEIARIIALTQLDPDDPVEIVAAWLDPHECDQVAGKILAIPEIRDALRYRNIVLASRMPDLPPDRVGELIRDLANRVAD